MIKRLILALALSLVLSTAAYGAGSVTCSYATPYNNIETVTYTWTADSGDGSVPATECKSINGWVFMAETNPGATAPTDNYDITLLIDSGVDIMGGSLANRDTANTEQAVPTIDTVNTVYGPRYVSEALQMNLSNNSVNSAVGTLTVYIWQEHIQ